MSVIAESDRTVVDAAPPAPGAVHMPPSAALPSLELNAILQKLDLSFLVDRMLAMPTRYYVSVSVVCDIVCPFCPRQYYGELVDNGVMSYEAFRTVAPHLKYADFAGMFGLGEPFLHKDFFRFLTLAKEAGAWTTTNSHGMSLTDEIVRKLIDHKLDHINCSMDGHNKKLFEFLRAGAVFETVIENLKRFTAIKKELGVEHPQLQIAVTVSRHNVAHMADMVKLAREVGATAISFSNLIIINPDNAHLSVVNTPLFDGNLAKAKELGKKFGIPVDFFFQNPLPWVLEPTDAARHGKRFGCHEAWRALTIERRGQTKPCCYIEEPIGNAFETPIAELRNSQAFIDLRRSLMEGRPDEFCRNCGNLRMVTRETASQRVEEAADLFAKATSLSIEEREWVAGLIGEYRTLAAALA